MTTVVPYATIGFVAGMVNTAISDIENGSYGLISSCNVCTIGVISAYFYNLLGTNVIDRLVPDSLQEYKKPVVIGFAACGILSHIYYSVKRKTASSKKENDLVVDNDNDKMKPIFKIKINKYNYIYYSIDD